MIVFIPAAGLGTRLRPLTEHCPKALVEYQGKPLLAHLLERLARQGFEHFVLNLHHFPQLLADYASRYAREHRIRIDFSDETGRLLDTGGALTHALPLFSGEEPVLVHNVDVISDLDLAGFCEDFRKSGAHAMLSVRKRDSKRLLYADEEGRLRAWGNRVEGRWKGECWREGFRPYAFSGVHVLQKRLIQAWAEKYGRSNPFSVIDAYLSSIPAFDIRLEEHTGGFWKDMGKIEDFQAGIPLQ